MSSSNKGFSLVELMVALAVSGFLMAGVSVVYLSLSESIDTTKDLESAQEVLRYSSEVFNRSLKQTTNSPVFESAGSKSLEVEQTTPGATACDGNVHPVPFTEIFTLDGNLLKCQVNASTHDLLTGIKDITFKREQDDSDLVQIFIMPENLTERMPVGGFRLDIALTSKIVMEGLN